MRTSDKLRLRAMEKELSDCWLDRYYGDSHAREAENPDVTTMRDDMFKYLESRSPESAIPTYFHYWDDENYRLRLWLLEQDPIARVMVMRIQRTTRDIIDGRVRRLKRVGDGSHLLVEEQPGQAEDCSTR